MPPREVELPLPAHLTPIRRRFTQGAHLELLLGAFEVAAGLKNPPKNTRNLENRPRKAAKTIENPCEMPNESCFESRGATMERIFRWAMRSALALRRFQSTAFERRSFKKPGERAKSVLKPWFMQ